VAKSQCWPATRVLQRTSLSAPQVTVDGDTAVAVNHSRVYLEDGAHWRLEGVSANRWELGRVDGDLAGQPADQPPGRRLAGGAVLADAGQPVTGCRLVTGGTGLAGSSVALKAARQGRRVRALVRKSAGSGPCSTPRSPPRSWTSSRRRCGRAWP
jgi:hypothetical protein